MVAGSAERFNEAAGRTPRKPRGRCSSPWAARCFNEAAGRTPRKPLPLEYQLTPTWGLQ